MTPQDWHLVTHAWNQTDFDYPRHRTLHQLFEATAAATPDAPAVLFEGSATSFGELNLQANRMANHLRELGVGPGVLVGLAVVRSVDMLVALLGVLKAGGAYVPLDPDYPRERLALLIQDSGCAVVLTQSAVAGGLPDCDATVIRLDADPQEWLDASAENPSPNTDPEDLALVIYTSGSTGTPKGVAIPHRVCVNRMHVDSDLLESGEVLCAKTSLNFIDSLWETFYPWTHGYPTLLLSGETIRDPQLLVQALAEARVTRLVLVPSLLRTILESHADLRIGCLVCDTGSAVGNRCLLTLFGSSASACESES